MATLAEGGIQSRARKTTRKQPGIRRDVVMLLVLGRLLVCSRGVKTKTPRDISSTARLPATTNVGGK
ncbi:unnamed protein product [Lampetra fluviatilis]